MTPEELGRIREVYEAALVLDGAARQELLERACRGQAGIRDEVQQLLQAQPRVPDWLNRPPLANSVRLLTGLEGPKMAGRPIGGYTIVREIGRGGMGCVYLAERSDGAFQKRVAIKVMIPSPQASAVIARFQQERQILASLDHPNIARLLDGGVTEEGWPYFVMEFVDGQPIDRWCDERKLSVTARLELFRGVIAAVQFAHQRLVVHRDLKPGNIYVAADGVVKLLDFDIAKVMLAHEMGAVADTLTLPGMMTPQYASPEQVEGSPVTTLSDVYSLGVVLYEVLTGHRPYRLPRAALPEIARIIAQVEPVRPSQVVTTTELHAPGGGATVTPESLSALRDTDLSRLRQRLSGDLDSILLKSLRKEPDGRYSSVEAFGADLERHLAHRPVAAREATAWYRLMRFCRRNLGGVVAGLLVLTSILTGVVAVFWQTRRVIVSSGPVPVDIGPFWLVTLGVALVGLGFAVYLTRPSKREFLSALAGGLIWGGSLRGEALVLQSMGWVRMQLGSLDKLLVFGQPIQRSSYPSIVFVLAFTAVLFLAARIQKRNGWRWAAIFLILFNLQRVNQDRFMFSTVLAAVEFEPGWIPFLASAAPSIAGGFVGLLVMLAIQRVQRRGRKKS